MDQQVIDERNVTFENIMVPTLQVLFASSDEALPNPAIKLKRFLI